VQDDVVGFEGGICLEFSTPVAIFVLLAKEEAARGIGSIGYAAGKIINLAKTKLWSRSGG